MSTSATPLYEIGAVALGYVGTVASWRRPAPNQPRAYAPMIIITTTASTDEGAHEPAQSITIASREGMLALRAAIDEAMVVHHLGTAEPTDDYETAKRKLNNLLVHAQSIGEHFAAQAGAPTIEAAHDMGAKGGPTAEAERLAFEAWMRGHCWRPGHWVGDEYNDVHTRGLWAAWRDRAALAAQAGPAQAPLTVDRLRTMAAEAESPEWGEWYSDDDALIRFAQAVERAAQAPASTRPADASISGQRVDMVPMTREQILRAAVAAMPATNPLVADDLIEGHTMHTEADDIIAIWNAALAAAPQAPAEQPLKERPDFIAGYDAGLADGKRCAERGDDEGPMTFGVMPREGLLIKMPNGDPYYVTPVAPAEPAAQAVEQDATLPVHEVWREGYRITGESEGARKLGEAQAATFAEACDIVCCDIGPYDAKTGRVWGCRLFNNEADARRLFG